jgi:non-ribosomal peptide synthetase component F
MQFDNYVQWQSTQDDLAALEESREFWLKCFADQVPLLELPTDRPRPKLYSFAGAEKRLSLGAELANKTKALCSRHGCTLFSTLLSAYTLLLSRVSGREELVVGIHSAGHMLVDGSDLVGHCINLVPLRSHANPEISFLEHIGANKKRMLDAYAHQLYPYSKLAKDLKLRRDPSRLTLVEAVFNLDSSAQGFKIFGLDAAADTVPTGYSKWDLSFDVCDTGNDIQIRCEYNRDLFNGETIDQWLKQYESILAVAVERPSANLLSLNQQVDLSVRKAREKSMNSLKAANLEKLRNTRRATALTAGVV